MIYRYPAAALVLFLYLGVRAYSDRRRGVPVTVGDFIESFMVMVPFVLVAVLIALVVVQAGLDSASRLTK